MSDLERTTPGAVRPPALDDLAATSRPPANEPKGWSSLAAMLSLFAPRWTIGAAFPANPVEGHVMIFGAAVAAGLVWQEADGTVLAAAGQADVARFDGLAWVRVGRLPGLTPADAAWMSELWELSYSDFEEFVFGGADIGALPYMTRSDVAAKPAGQELVFRTAVYADKPVKAGYVMRAGVEALIDGTVWAVWATDGDDWVGYWHNNAWVFVGLDGIAQSVESPASLGEVGTAWTLVDPHGYDWHVPVDLTPQFLRRETDGDLLYVTPNWGTAYGLFDVNNPFLFVHRRAFKAGTAFDSTADLVAMQTTATADDPVSNATTLVVRTAAGLELLPIAHLRRHLSPSWYTFGGFTYESTSADIDSAGEAGFLDNGGNADDQLVIKLPAAVADDLRAAAVPGRIIEYYRDSSNYRYATLDTDGHSAAFGKDFFEVVGNFHVVGAIADGDAISIRIETPIVTTDDVRLSQTPLGSLADVTGSDQIIVAAGLTADMVIVVSFAELSGSNRWAGSIDIRFGDVSDSSTNPTRLLPGNPDNNDAVLLIRDGGALKARKGAGIEADNILRVWRRA